MEYSRRIYRPVCVIPNMRPERDILATTGVESAILSLLDFLPLGFLIVTQAGTVVATNRAATRILESAEVLTERSGIVLLSFTAAGKKIRELIRVAKEGVPTGLRIVRPGRDPILVVASPLPRREDQPNAPPTAVVYVADGQARQAIDPILLAGLFGFTPAESKVAVQMMQGHTVEDIATQLGISPHTTRNHLKRLYAKTGTRKQCEFVHALLTSPARFAFSVPVQKAAAAAAGEEWHPLPAATEPADALHPV